MTSLDVHDIVVLIDGRPELADELFAQGGVLGAYVAQEIPALRDQPYFDYVVQGWSRAMET